MAQQKVFNMTGEVDDIESACDERGEWYTIEPLEDSWPFSLHMSADKGTMKEGTKVSVVVTIIDDEEGKPHGG